MLLALLMMMAAKQGWPISCLSVHLPVLLVLCSPDRKMAACSCFWMPLALAGVECFKNRLHDSVTQLTLHQEVPPSPPKPPKEISSSLSFSRYLRISVELLFLSILRSLCCSGENYCCWWQYLSINLKSSFQFGKKKSKYDKYSNNSFLKTYLNVKSQGASDYLRWTVKDKTFTHNTKGVHGVRSKKAKWCAQLCS